MEPIMAVVWHFWIGVVLAATAIGAMFAVIALYLLKVTRTRYPR